MQVRIVPEITSDSCIKSERIKLMDSFAQESEVIPGMILRSSGMILLSTLSMIIIITLLLLTQMQQIVLYAKALGRQNAGYKRLEEMESITEQLINNKALLDNGDCLVEKDDANAIIRLVEKKGCKASAKHYQFLIEDLGLFDCLAIKQDGRLFASHHHRFSLVYSNNHDVQEKVYLQIRLIEPSGFESSCKQTKILKRRLSGWRFGNI